MDVRPFFTISRNAASASGITDKRDWRTNGIPFSRGLVLISPSVTGCASGLTDSKIDGGPIAFLRCRVPIRGSHHFRDSDNRFLLAAMIEKNFIAFAHFAEIISRSIIAHAGPIGLAFQRQSPTTNRRMVPVSPAKTIS